MGYVLTVRLPEQRPIECKARTTLFRAHDSLERGDAIACGLRWSGDPSYFGRTFKRLVAVSGVNRGTFKWLRRSSGSYVDLQLPGAGTKHLGHSDPRMFTTHYDGQLGGHTLPQPPDLEVEKV